MCHGNKPPDEGRLAPPARSVSTVSGALTVDNLHVVDSVLVAQRVCSEDVTRGEDHNGGEDGQGAPCDALARHHLCWSTD